MLLDDGAKDEDAESKGGGEERQSMLAGVLERHRECEKVPCLNYLLWASCNGRHISRVPSLCSHLQNQDSGSHQRDVEHRDTQGVPPFEAGVRVVLRVCGAPYARMSSAANAGANLL